jgi:5-methylcytosine-specific restriction endonuclease McrA
VRLSTFSYPKSRHIRLENPKQYKRYQAYRPYLEREFSHQCVYCRSPDWLDPSAIFTIDHYKPKDFHKTLECHYPNLFYCCHACNSRKGTHPYVKDHRTKQLRATLTWSVPNPCDHIMADHIRVNSTSFFLTPRSTNGKYTIELLDLNSDERIRHRRLHEEAIRRLGHQLKELLHKQKKLANKIACLPEDSTELTRSTNLAASLSKKLIKLRDDLAYLSQGKST